MVKKGIISEDDINLNMDLEFTFKDFMYLFKKDPFAKQMLSVIDNEFIKLNEARVKKENKKKREDGQPEIMDIFNQNFK